MHVLLVSRRVPPARCGVGDHTIELANAIAGLGHQTTVLTGTDQLYASPHQNLFPIRVAPNVPSWTAGGCFQIQGGIEAMKPDHVILQWVPSLYDARGLAPSLASSFGRLRKLGIRLTTVVHEPWVAFDRWQHFISGPIQRIQLGMLCAASDAVAVSTTTWTRELREWFPWAKKRISWVPTASNIPVSPLNGGKPSARQLSGLPSDGVVIGTFSPLGAGKGRHLMEGAWATVSRRDPAAHLLVVGITAPEGVVAFPNLAAPDRVRFTGPLDATGVSRALQALDVYMAPFVDGLSTRRASALAALAHGVPTVTTRGHLFDAEVFSQSPLVVTDYRAPEFADAVSTLAADEGQRAAMGVATLSFYDLNFGFERIAQSLLAHGTS